MFTGTYFLVSTVQVDLMKSITMTFLLCKTVDEAARVVDDLQHIAQPAGQEEHHHPVDDVISVTKVYDIYTTILSDLPLVVLHMKDKKNYIPQTQ